VALRPLPKALDDLAAVQRADLYPATPVHEGWEILPAFDRLRPVLGYASGCLVDLAEDEDGVARELRVRVDRIGALGTLRDLVGQEGRVAIAGVSSHSIDVALEDPIALGDVIRTHCPHDDDVCLPDFGHRLPPLRRGGRRSALLAACPGDRTADTPPSPAWRAHGTETRCGVREREQEQALVARRLGYRNARIGARRRHDRAGV